MQEARSGGLSLLRHRNHASQRSLLPFHPQYLNHGVRHKRPSIQKVLNNELVVPIQRLLQHQLVELRPLNRRDQPRQLEEDVLLGEQKEPGGLEVSKAAVSYKELGEDGL